MRLAGFVIRRGGRNAPTPLTGAFLFTVVSGRCPGVAVHAGAREVGGEKEGFVMSCAPVRAVPRGSAQVGYCFSLTGAAFEFLISSMAARQSCLLL